MTVTMTQWAAFAGRNLKPVPLAFDTEARPADCEECGEPMEWNDAICYDPECDCQHYSPRLHVSTGSSDCEES